MKSIRNVLAATLLTAGAALLAASSMSMATAADVSASPPPPDAPGPHGWHHHRGAGHLLGKLGLSDAQKVQIKDIMTASRPQMQSLHEQMRANSLKLQQTSPTDPNYSSIVSQVSQMHGSLVAQGMTQRAEVRAQVFKVLTPAQQTQLTALEAQMRSTKHGHWGGPPPGEPSAE
ncbi:MAG: Spy/CpxP family protein refolding chaperone [Gammaproteobacteria bacterium]